MEKKNKNDARLLRAVSESVPKMSGYPTCYGDDALSSDTILCAMKRTNIQKHLIESSRIMGLVLHELSDMTVHYDYACVKSNLINETTPSAQTVLLDIVKKWAARTEQSHEYPPSSCRNCTRNS